MQFAAEGFDDVCPPQVATPRSAGRDAGSVSGIDRLFVAYVQFRAMNTSVRCHVCLIMYVHSMFLFLMWPSSRAHRGWCLCSCMCVYSCALMHYVNVVCQQLLIGRGPDPSRCQIWAPPTTHRPQRTLPCLLDPWGHRTTKWVAGLACPSIYRGWGWQW